MFSLKNILFVNLPLSISIFHLSLMLFSFHKYYGNVWIFLIYNILIFLYLFYSFAKSNFFFDKFLSLLIYLGFGFKLTYSFFTIGHLSEVSSVLIKKIDCDLYKDCRSKQFELISSGELYDDALKIVIIAVMVLLLLSFFSNKFIKIKSQNNNKPNLIYQNNRFFIIFFLIISSIIIVLVNYNFGIFQKGLSSNYIVKPVFTWLLMFGLSSLFCTLAYIEFLRSKPSIYIMMCIMFLENFLSSLSSLSRGMIYNSSSYFLALGKFKYSFNLIKTSIIFLFMIILFVIY